MGLENELQQLNILFLRREELQLQDSDYVEFFIHDIAIDRLWPMTRKGKESITSEYMGEGKSSVRVLVYIFYILVLSPLPSWAWFSSPDWHSVVRSATCCTESDIKSALTSLRWVSEQSWSQVERSLPRKECELQDMLGTWTFSAGGRSEECFMLRCDT